MHLPARPPSGSPRSTLAPRSLAPPRRATTGRRRSSPSPCPRSDEASGRCWPSPPRCSPSSSVPGWRGCSAPDDGGPSVAGQVEYAGPMDGPDGEPADGGPLDHGDRDRPRRRAATRPCCRSCRRVSSTRSGSSGPATRRSAEPDLGRHVPPGSGRAQPSDLRRRRRPGTVPGRGDHGRAGRRRSAADRTGGAPRRPRALISRATRPSRPEARRGEAAARSIAAPPGRRPPRRGSPSVDRRS